MEPLTDLVIRAGAAILAVNRRAMTDRGQARRIAGNGSRSRRRPHHCRGPGAARPGHPGAVRRARRSGEAALSRQLLPDRSARRHQGIRRRPRRVHGQPRAGDGRDAAVGHRRRAGARIDLARPGRPRRRTAAGRRSGRARRPSRSIPAASRRAANPGSSPSAARMATPDRSLHRAPARRVRETLGSAVKFGRVAEGGSRYLSAPCADLANGISPPATRSSPPPAARSPMRKARDLQFGEGRERIYRAGIHRLGRSGGGRALIGLAAGYCARSCSQRRPARVRLARRKCSGSAAKASRLASRLNR